MLISTHHQAENSSDNVLVQRLQAEVLVHIFAEQLIQRAVMIIEGRYRQQRISKPIQLITRPKKRKHGKTNL